MYVNVSMSISIMENSCMRQSHTILMMCLNTAYFAETEKLLLKVL